MSSVLYETGGVISEERYQKMTPIQWIFQHRVVQKNKKRNFEETMMLNDLLAEDIETLAMVFDPKIGKAFLEKKAEIRRERLEARTRGSGRAKLEDVNPSNMDINNDSHVKEIMEKYYDTAPDTIKPPKHLSEKHRFVTDTFNRDEMRRLKTKRRFIALDDKPKTAEEKIDELELKPRGTK